ncbi:hypothetical protein GALMADRAFT_78099 [Galerina marginata CBS 339.88]|uniref:Uncharacterized protein n=1 Tax=Galerina marginata (strain CBS 339.88) TaxID=685588 RepID=A0A067SPI9_GALM3|nr:hypothetical protein GALMADRAFT_78099 [Galerina marginata CBS 339.88]
MRLRNCKETVPCTIEDTLRDVHPRTLDEPFHWFASPGDPVWILSADEKGNTRKWRKGNILGETGIVICDKLGILRTYGVRYKVNRQDVFVAVTPGLQPELKPDTLEVRALLREAGMFI